MPDVIACRTIACRTDPPPEQRRKEPSMSFYAWLPDFIRLVTAMAGAVGITAPEVQRSRDVEAKSLDRLSERDAFFAENSVTR